MAARRAAPAAKESYRSPELDDVAGAIDRLTFGLAGAEDPESLLAPTFKRILLACDSSAGSRHALEWAVHLGKRLQAHVTVVSVAPSQAAARAIRANPMAWQVVEPAFGEGEEHAEKVVKRAQVALQEAGVEHSVQLLHGPAGASIVDFAANDGSDLVVLGSHGHGLGERLNLGSVGTAVKHHVACSVLVARGSPRIKKVLLCSDGSQRSKIAFDVGADLARHLGARIVLAHVVDPSAQGLGNARDDPGKKLLKMQQRLRGELAQQGLENVVVAGHPAAALRKIATGAKADLIVVGSRGLGGLRSLTLGSVSDKLTHKAEQSVLVVKPKPA